jgi:hypothetical protein
MSKMPCTQLSLEYLRKQGMKADVVERIIPSKPFPKKHDLFNLFDIIAIDTGESGRDHKCVRFIQTTSASNRASRRNKMEAEAAVMFALQAIGSPVSVELHSWSKRGASYELIIETTWTEYGSDGRDHVGLLRIAHRSMKEVRAEWRKNNPDPQQEREKVRGPGKRSS